MDILSINADRNLTSIAACIGRNPQSWRGWQCLFIKCETNDSAVMRECLMWAKAIVESYLAGTEGRIYACCNGDIHLICRGISTSLLNQIAIHIRDYFDANSRKNVSYFIYDLEKDGYTYASSVFARNGDVLSELESAEETSETEMLETFSQHESQFQETLSKKGFAKVLLVEDDPVTRWMVRQALKDECQLATAPSANRAFTLYPSWKPDIVFLDINLPDNNGLAVLEWIKRNDPGACVVMFSSVSNMDSISCALEEGANGFVAKPFLRENLLHYVRATHNA